MRNHLSNLQTFLFLILNTPSQRDVPHTLKKTHTKVALKKSCDIQQSCNLICSASNPGLGIPKSPCLLHAFHTHIQHSVLTFLGGWEPQLFRCPVSVFFASTNCVNTQYTVRFLVLRAISMFVTSLAPFSIWAISILLFHIHIL